MKRIVIIMLSIVSLVLLYGCSSQTYTAETIIEMNRNPIEINQLQLQFQASEIRDEVKPSNPQGYYPHYKKQEGYHYHVVSGTLKITVTKLFVVINLKLKVYTKMRHMRKIGIY